MNNGCKCWRFPYSILRTVILSTQTGLELKLYSWHFLYSHEDTRVRGSICFGRAAPYPHNCCLIAFSILGYKSPRAAHFTAAPNGRGIHGRFVQTGIRYSSLIRDTSNSFLARYFSLVLLPWQLSSFVSAQNKKNSNMNRHRAAQCFLFHEFNSELSWIKPPRKEPHVFEVDPSFFHCSLYKILPPWIHFHSGSTKGI